MAFGALSFQLLQCRCQLGQSLILGRIGNSNRHQQKKACGDRYSFKHDHSSNYCAPHLFGAKGGDLEVSKEKNLFYIQINIFGFNAGRNLLQRKFFLGLARIEVIPQLDILSPPKGLVPDAFFEEIEQSRIEFAPPGVGHDIEGLTNGVDFLVGTLGCQGIKEIRNGGDAGEAMNLRPLQPLGVPRTVVVFVMLVNNPADDIEIHFLSVLLF